MNNEYNLNKMNKQKLMTKNKPWTDCQIGDDGLKQMTELMKTNTTLTELDLVDKDDDDDGDDWEQL